MSDESSTTEPSRSRARRPLVITTAILSGAALIAIGVIASNILTGGVTAESSASGAVQTDGVPATEPVVRGTLTSETRVNGTLIFDGQRPVASGPAGIVTRLPEVGTKINAGDALYSVNDQPVVLLRGDVPAWRTFESGMSEGVDVQQLESNLQTLGFFSGTVDTKFTPLTAEAIASWQAALGMERTGTVDATHIVFAHDDLRIASLKAALGAPVGAGTEVLSVSADRKVVQADIKLDDQSLAVKDSPVSIALPDGTVIEGTVSVVGAPENKDAADGSTATTIPITVVLTDQDAAAKFQRAPVTLGFASTQSKDALSVPVAALLALDNKTFGVEVIAGNGATTRIPVKTGLFAAGRVEITGEGIAEGVKVVVPKR